MENVRLTISELDKHFPGWMKSAVNESNLFFQKDWKYRELLIVIITELRSIKKADDKELFEKFEQMIDNDKFFELFNTYIENTLIFYRNLEGLRRGNLETQEKIKTFLDDVFQNHILRFDPEIAQRFEEYHLSSEEEADKAIQSIGSLTEYYIRRLYVTKYIIDDFKDETGFGDDICKYYAELLDKNFKEIKLNILMQDMENLQTNLEYLQE